jgi:O-antigen/teichoic acid export membrane protein
MLLTMAVSLYTSRVVLQSLGVTDYGVYNVVGGVVSMFGFLNGALSGATQRFLTFSIAGQDAKQTNEVFCTSVVVHAILSLIIVLLAQTMGLWFLNSQLNIPADRMVAANWVYQFSIIATVVMVMSVPYNALLIAHERMSAFAYISIVEVSLKLAVAFAITMIAWDRLVVYAFLILAIQVAVRLIYGSYCKKHFAESNFRLLWDSARVKAMTSFAGWNLFGSLASILSTQGENILLNIFFGPVVNAARGVAMQVQYAILSFCTNFQMAVNPQITKTYAVGDLGNHHKLICASAKFSTMLVMILSIPVLVYTQEILSIWLTEVPAHTVTFIRIILLTALVDSSMGPFIVSITSYGRIRNASIIGGFIILMMLPISYLLLQFHRVATIVLWVHFAIAVIAQVVRIGLVHRYVGLPWSQIRRVYIPLLCSFVVASALAVVLKARFSTGTVVNTLLWVAVTGLLDVAVGYLVGITSSEKALVKQIIKRRLCRI